MTQFLHIFKKDVHRHWPEILISLFFLAHYTRSELHPLTPYGAMTLFSDIAASYVPSFLILSWIFLIFRVVQSESLVGDRQWWVTKPYVWWQLLFSKLLFVVVFISVPLFSVQLILLHHAGFPVHPHLVGLFLMQSPLGLIMVCAFALASLTRNLAQALLAIGITVVVLVGGSLALNHLSSHTMSDSPSLVGALESILLCGSLVLVPVWQFARRRTWASRIILAAFIGAAAVLSLIPFASHVEQRYPLLAAKDSPAQFTIPSILQSQSKSDVPSWMTSDTFLSIPLNVSGIAPGSVVLIDGMKITVNPSENSPWPPGWFRQSGQLWPGSQRYPLSFTVKLKEYERVKAEPLNLHIQLALSEYGEAEARTLVIPNTVFHDPVLGTCRLLPRDYPPFPQCQKPFQPPSYMGRFDAPNSPCGSGRRLPDGSPTNLDVAYAWSRYMRISSGGFGLTPIVTYQPMFYSPPPIPDANSTAANRSDTTALCPGAEIRLGRPVLKRKFRIQLELPNVRLEDLDESTRAAD